MRLIKLNESEYDVNLMAILKRWCADKGVNLQNAVLYVPSTDINPWLSSRFHNENGHLFYEADQGYYSAEHYLQAAKIDLLLTKNDHLQLGLDVEKLINLRTQILNTVSVNKAVGLTRKQANYVCQGQTNKSENTPRSINDLLNKTSWYKSQRFRSLKTATMLKFEQNTELRELLLATGDAPIIGLTLGEHPAYYTWGTAYENKRPGQNRLGCILMEVRIELLLSEYKEQPSKSLPRQCGLFYTPQEVNESALKNSHLGPNAI